jgi:hypothetical protein
MKKLSFVFLFVIAIMSLINLQTAFGQDTQPYWSLAGNSNATASSKLGTTNSIPLRILTNNVERIRVDAAGKVGIGTTAPVNIFTIKTGGATPVSKWYSGTSKPILFGFSEAVNTDLNLSTASATPAQRPIFAALRSRGTLGLPTAVASNDYLASITAFGYDGAAFQNPISLDMIADGAPTSGHVPAKFSFITGTSIADRKERLRIASSGNFTFNTNQLFIKASTGNVGIGTTSPPATDKLTVVGGSANNSAGIVTSAASYGIQATSTAGGFGVLANCDGNIGVYGAGGYAGISGYGSGTDSYGLLGNGSGYGVYGSSANYGVYGTGFVGLYGSSSTPAGDGVRSNVSGNSTYGINAYSASSFGIYAATGNSGSYAGYFSGNVYCSGVYSGSDEKLKKDITSFDNAMDIINGLKPKFYEYRDDGNFAKMNLPKGKHFGFVAQDMEKILPGLVKQTTFNTAKAVPSEDFLTSSKPDPKGAISREVSQPKQNEVKGEMIDFKAVNYTELIPILVKAMQEQYQLISEKDKIIEDLKTEVERIKEILIAKGLTAVKDTKGNGDDRFMKARLDQNIPNPVDGSTTVRYFLPSTVNRASLLVTASNGTIVKSFPITKSGEGKISLMSADLPSGSYYYSLLINGKMSETKKMIISR